MDAQERGDFLKALELEDKAMLQYQEDKDNLGFAEIQAMRFLTLRHLYKKTGQRGYLLLAKHAIESGVDIAGESGLKEALAIPLFNLAKLYEEMGQLKAAVAVYKKAVDNILHNPDKAHDRKTVKLDFQIHLCVAEYKLGKKSALVKAEKLIQELENTPEDPDYEKKVWISTAHMGIADMLQKDNPAKSKEHLKAAKQIIDNDERLKLVGGQWKKLAEKILKCVAAAVVIPVSIFKTFH